MCVYVCSFASGECDSRSGADFYCSTRPNLTTRQLHRYPLGQAEFFLQILEKGRQGMRDFREGGGGGQFA